MEATTQPSTLTRPEINQIESPVVAQTLADIAGIKAPANAPRSRSTTRSCSDWPSHRAGQEEHRRRHRHLQIEVRGQVHVARPIVVYEPQETVIENPRATSTGGCTCSWLRQIVCVDVQIFLYSHQLVYIHGADRYLVDTHRLPASDVP